MRAKYLVLLVALALVTATAAGVRGLYSNPPIISWSIHSRHSLGNPKEIHAFGIDLRNEGRWPVTLTEVTVDGMVVESPAAKGIANHTDGHIAANAALLPEEAHKLSVGPVAGWRIEPRAGITPPPKETFGLLLGWNGEVTAPVEVVIRYRYLGFPMRYVVLLPAD